MIRISSPSMLCDQPLPDCSLMVNWIFLLPLQRPDHNGLFFHIIDHH